VSVAARRTAETATLHVVPRWHDVAMTSPPAAREHVRGPGSDRTARLVALCFDADEPVHLARFWAAALRWDVDETAGEISLVPTDGTGFRLRFVPPAGPKREKNRLHLDLTTSSLEDQEQTVAALLELGGRLADVGQGPQERHVVLADPEGNELCVIEPENSFLAGCGRLGSITCDGSPVVGAFWSAALGWPLVWDQDGETAVRAPYGGPKVTWGGPPVRQKSGRNRLHLDVAPDAGSDQGAEVDRLLSLGATRAGRSHHEAGAVELHDPDGNEFCVLATP
jgi:hypothetical protein